MSCCLEIVLVLKSNQRLAFGDLKRDTLIGVEYRYDTGPEFVPKTCHAGERAGRGGKDA
jgi:hypothetical protein